MNKNDGNKSNHHIAAIVYSVFFWMPVTHVLKTHSWFNFENLKFLLARATIPSSTGFTPDICSSIIAWLRADPSPVAPRCGDLWAGRKEHVVKS